MNIIGVDYHKSYSHVTILDDHGQELWKGRIGNRPEDVAALFENLQGESKAVIEATRNWLVMHDLLEQFCDVTLAHPLKVKAISSAKIKTDAIDSRVLADLLRADLIPEAHVPSKNVRLARNVLRQRLFFVRMRTMVKNRIHGLIDRHPEIEKGEGMDSDLFGKSGRTWLREIDLPPEERKLLDGELSLLDALDARIKSSDRWVSDLAKGNRDVALLKTIPGIGPFFAVLLWAEIDGIDRFAHPKKLAAYAGLVPSTYSSGGKTHHGRITRQGNKWIRWAMVEAVKPAITSDWWLRGHYEHIKARAGYNGAKVATARRLLTLVFRVLSERRVYRPAKEKMRDNIRASIEKRKIPAAPMAF